MYLFVIIVLVHIIHGVKLQRAFYGVFKNSFLFLKTQNSF